VGVSENSVKDAFNIMPLTYALPHEFNAFVKGFISVQQASGNNRSNFWIIKPIGSSRGRGISLVDSVSDVSYSQPIVVQKYISDPLCFMGYKFDLRIYVLVSSFSPLEAFIYKEGLARFGSRQYTASSQSINDLRIHLTNSSIQKEFGVEVDKNHPAYLAGTNGAESKVALTWLWKRLDELGIDSKLLWQSVVDVCIKALIAGGSDIPFQPNSFELFGFDVMFDRDLKCWLIEVNSSPSLSCDSPLDTRIKGALIRDTVALIDPVPIDQRALVDVCTRRLSHRKEASTISSTSILEEDLGRILHERIPRAYGDMPSRLGSYERIAPETNTYNSLMHK
jgi:tubulin polyglutamylase TTLL5